MQTDLNRPSATVEYLFTLAQKGDLDSPALEQSLRLIGHIPNRSRWRQFLEYTLLILGMLFLISGIFFFFAYNWNEIDRFVKFGLIEAGILLAVGIAQIRGLDTLSGKIALTSAALLVGALLAVFGQTYQVIADAYTLFLSWTLLIGGWVLIGRYAPLWFILHVLLNLALYLFWEQTQPDINYKWTDVLFLFNVVVLAVWEAAQRLNLSWLKGRWFPQLVGVVALAFVTFPTIEFIMWQELSVNNIAREQLSTVLAYLIFLPLVLYIYTCWIHDAFMLTVAILSLIGVVTSLVGRVLDFDEIFMFLIMGIVVILQASLAVLWLRRVLRSWEGVNVSESL